VGLLRAAAQLTERIPVTDEYRLDREFCWLAVGKAAILLARDSLFRQVLSELPEGRISAELRLTGLTAESAAVREEIVLDFLQRLAFWEPHLHRSELSDLMRVFARRFSLANLVGSVSFVEDPFTRTTMLVSLSESARDPVIKRSLLADALRAAGEVVSGDIDYALKHVAGGYIEAGLPADALQVIDSMETPAIRVDFREYLARALDEAGRELDAVVARAEREADLRETSGVVPESEWIALAEELLVTDLYDDLPSDRTLFARVEDLMRAGDTAAALTIVRERFPTRLCPATLELPADELSRLLLFQLSSVLSYHLNDLKVEFLADLAVELHRRDRVAPVEVLNFVESPEFLAVEPASVPGIRAVDLSRGDFDHFVTALFARPVAVTEEEERIFRRERDDDPGLTDDEAFLRQVAELFRRFGEVAPRFSPEQVDQAMWFLTGYPFSIHDVMSEPTVSETVMIELIQAEYHIFAGYVAVHDLPESFSRFRMLWDERWRHLSEAANQALVDVMTRVLELPAETARYAALCGLNHLIRRGILASAVPSVIGGWLEREGANLSAELREYAEDCRAGAVV